ncbi:MAG: rod shape-determining protein MreC [Sarcina sp.]
MKFFKNKLAVTIIVLSVAFLMLIIYTAKSGSGVISNALGETFNPIQKVVYTIGDKFKGSLDFVSNISEVKAENTQLKAENIQLQNELVGYNTYKNENEVLKQSLNFKNEHNQFNYIGADIIGKSGGSFFNGYIIDRGSDSGIQKNMVVISGNSLVGVVTEVYGTWAKVDTIANTNVAVAAQVESTNEASGIVKGYKDMGTMKPMAQISNLPMTSQIKVGDNIITSGIGGIYPQGIRIGTVSSIQENNAEVSKSAIIQPSADFTTMQQVVVVVPKNPIPGDINYN